MDCESSIFHRPSYQRATKSIQGGNSWSRRCDQRELSGMAKYRKWRLSKSMRRRTNPTNSQFWMQAAFHAATFIGLVAFYHPVRRSDYPKMSVRAYIWSMDPIGSFLFIGACTLILLGLDWTGGAYPWKSTHVDVPLGVGGSLLIAFALYGKAAIT